MNLPIKPIDIPRINHPKYTAALNMAYVAASMAKPGDIVFITGPTGVGKSMLLDELLDMLCGQSSTWNEGSLPLIRMSLDVTKAGACMRNLAIQLNRALGNPFCAPTCLPTQDAESYRARTRHTENDLRESARHLIDSRHTRFVGLDESQHINPRKMEAATVRFDSLKMLVGANRSRPSFGSFILVMAGHYSLLKLASANTQLHRRITTISLGVYYAKSQSDVIAWEKILIEMAKPYPVGTSFLRELNSILFEMSHGNLGLLNLILHKANIAREAYGDLTIGIEHIVAAAPTNAFYEDLKKEIEDFEAVTSCKLWLDKIANRKTDASVPKPKKSASTSGRRGRRSLGARDRVGARS